MAAKHEEGKVTKPEEGYLISYCADLHMHHQNEYVLNKGALFHFHLVHHPPDDAVIVCMTLFNEVHEDEYSKLDKTVKDKVKEVLTDKGLHDVHVYVIVTNEEGSERMTKDIQLRIRVPHSISNVTDQELITPLSQYLTTAGYNVQHVVLTGTLVSSGKFILKPGLDKHKIPKGTKFTFIPTNGDTKRLFLMTERESILKAIGCRHRLTEDMILTTTISNPTLIVKLTYFFDMPMSCDYFAAIQVAEFLQEQMQSDDYGYIIVRTEEGNNSSTGIVSMRFGSINRPKWVGIEVESVDLNNPRQDFVIPNVQEHLERYFSDTPNGPYNILPQFPPPTSSLQ